jgi:hypothetical protein
LVLTRGPRAAAVTSAAKAPPTPEEKNMNASNNGDEFEELELSDDDLDLVAGGLPRDERDPTFESMTTSEPRGSSQSMINNLGQWY